jgi:hypothetical protein
MIEANHHFRLNHVLRNYPFLFRGSAIGEFGNSNLAYGLASPTGATAFELYFLSCVRMKSHAEKPREVSQLDDSLDWNALRLESLAPGGFGAARAHIWHASSPLHHSPLFPQLLNFTFQAQIASRRRKCNPFHTRRERERASRRTADTPRHRSQLRALPRR